MSSPVGPTKLLAGRISLVTFCAARAPYFDRETWFIVLPMIKLAPPVGPRETASVAWLTETRVSSVTA
jgi:hypothetical protein